MKLVAAVLAAGASRRLGHPKQLVSFRGEPLVRRAVAAATLPGVAEIAVVLGANAASIAPVLDAHVVRLDNPSWPEGMASSLRAAVAWAERRDADGLLVLLSDQPLVGASHVARLVSAWREGTVAVASAYVGVLGVPALFDARLFSNLAALRGDQGASSILRARPDVASVPCPEAALDIDGPSHPLAR